MNKFLDSSLRTLCILFFTIFCLILVWTKLNFEPLLLYDHEKLTSWLFLHVEEERQAARPNLRITGTLIAVILLEINTFIFNFHFWGVEHTPFFSGSNPLLNNSVSNLDAQIPPLFALFVIYPIVTLSPILILALKWENSPARSLILTIATMSAISGWNSTFISSIFAIPNIFMEWPQAYFLFQQRLASYDLSTIGILIFIFLYLRFRRKSNIFELILIAILAQFTFEYMGLILLCAMFFQSYYTNQNHTPMAKFICASKDVSIVGITIVSAILASTLVFFGMGNTLIQTIPGVSAIDANFESLDHVKWWLIIMIGMLMPPILIGGVIGTIYGFIGRAPSKSDLRKDLSILGGALVGFFLVLAIGAFTAYYPSELGRQMLPMAIVVLLFSMRISEYAVYYLIVNNKNAR